MVTYITRTLNNDPQDRQVRRQDFVWSLDDHNRAKALAEAYGLSLTRLLTLLIREEVRRPRLRWVMAPEDVQEIVRRKLSR